MDHLDDPVDGALKTLPALRAFVAGPFFEIEGGRIVEGRLRCRILLRPQSQQVDRVFINLGYLIGSSVSGSWA